MNMKKTTMAAAVAMALGVAGVANAAPVSITSGTFAMTGSLGLDSGTLASSNPVTGSVVDTTVVGNVDAAAGTWAVSSPTKFFGHYWTASNGQLVNTVNNGGVVNTVAGYYALDTGTGTLTKTATDTSDGSTADHIMSFQVGPNQVAGTIQFAWNGSTGIDVVEVWNTHADGSLTLAQTPGMENGPFGGSNAQFQLNGTGLVSAVPAPASVWLFGGGMIGLMGLLRRGRKAGAAGSLSA